MYFGRKAKDRKREKRRHTRKEGGKGREMRSS
jgi:hypothetical protein